MWEPDGRDVLLLGFNSGRVGAVEGSKRTAVAVCLSVAGVNWTQTELRKLHIGSKQDICTYNCTLRCVRKIAKSNCY